MVKDHKCGQTEQGMMVVGTKTKFKDMVNLYMPIKMNMKENSMQIEQMVLEDMCRSVVKRMKVSGLMTSPMEKES